MLSRALRCMSRLKLWKIMLMDFRALFSSLVFSLVMSWPSTITEPEVGRSSRFMHRTRVDLPAPDRPMMPKISPDRMSRLISSRACTALSPVPKVLFRCWI